MTRNDAEALDRNDALAPLRERFELPEGVIYLDGNSLGGLPKAAAARVREVVAQQWGSDLIRSWNVHDWINLPATVGAKIGRLIGAAPETVTVADSTSINVFKVLSAALAKQPGRPVILTETGNFPTDRYMAEAVAALRPGTTVRAVAAAELAAALDESVAVLLLTEVDYRSGGRHDMQSLTAAAHRVGALAIWDLAHSAGAVPVDLGAANADFAVGCGYKFLNGGPGAPAFVYAAPRHLQGLRQPLTGWLGHKAPFTFAEVYAPAPGIESMRVGTPPILSLAALDAALDAFADVDLAALKAKADRLFDLFAALVASRAPELTLGSPTDARMRGSQICFRHPEAYPVMQALIARGVIGDFREPDILRFGITPLYQRFVDIWDAAAVLSDVLGSRAWDDAAFRTRAAVV